MICIEMPVEQCFDKLVCAELSAECRVWSVECGGREEQVG